MEEDSDDNVQDTKTTNPNCKEWKVCIVGDMGVGKSSILTRIKDSTFSINALTTTGAIFATITVTVDNQQHKFIIWDTPGQERFRYFAPVYYRGIRAAILVYSITDRRSYRSVTGHWTASVRSHIPSDGRKIVMCLVGNKADMEDERKYLEKKQRVLRGKMAQFLQKPAPLQERT
ncbi:ras-related protein Rab-22A-like [Amphiura filiformis]|uniref:ras-related protein Rab-22A-like n=1 Tax=Amphiura filiformis TaxID=82378 RepID=UPI003B20CC43